MDLLSGLQTGSLSSPSHVVTFRGVAPPLASATQMSVLWLRSGSVSPRLLTKAIRFPSGD